MILKHKTGKTAPWQGEQVKFIHVSDLHLTAPGTILWGLDTCGRAERCLDDAARWHGDAEFCVISGDLTEKGEREAYEWLARKLANFPLKCFVMPGNHDNRETLCAAFPGAERDANGFLQQVVETQAGTFLLLDTLRDAPGSAGDYCASRCEWLAARLEEAKDRPVWIVMHHPPFDVAIPTMDRIKLTEPRGFTEVIAGHGNIRHIFFGHVHRALYTNWNGIPCTALPGTSHQVPLVRESVTTRYSVEPAMYAVVHIDGDRTIVHFEACLDRRDADMELREQPQPSSPPSPPR